MATSAATAEVVRVSKRAREWHSEVRRDELFDAAFLELYPRAFRLAFRILGEGAAAEDIAAEAMARMFAEWNRLRDLSYRAAWVMKVTTNLAFKQSRRTSRAPAPLASAGADRMEQAAIDRAVLGEAIRSLPSRQRQVIALRHLSDLTEGEVAEILQISIGTVKKHTHRGMRSLRERLGAATGEVLDDPQ